MAMLSRRVNASAVRWPEIVIDDDYTISRKDNGRRLVFTGEITVTVQSPGELGPGFEAVLLARGDLVKLEPGDEQNWLKSFPADPEATLPFSSNQTMRLFTFDGKLLCHFMPLPELFFHE